jgi:hypothetical protein
VTVPSARTLGMAGLGVALLAALRMILNDETGGIDIAIVRPDDPTGVAGTGLLSAILFDAVGGGTANMTVTGTGSGPGGGPVPLVFGATPGVTVR